MVQRKNPTEERNGGLKLGMAKGTVQRVSDPTLMGRTILESDGYGFYITNPSQLRVHIILARFTDLTQPRANLFLFEQPCNSMTTGRGSQGNTGWGNFGLMHITHGTGSDLANQPAAIPTWSSISNRQAKLTTNIYLH